ncbi:MAG: glycosyltransferase family 4 protein [Pyrinomonadaceae bacterium]|nr:glycosyltransferase family 4 protein [Pyrinomonadaceae bacterium]
MSSESANPVESGPAESRPTLWVISELYYPEETSTGYYMTRTAEGLTDRFKVKALCGQPNYSSRGTKAPRHEFRRDVEIFRAAGTTLNKNVIAFRLINMITLSTSIFFKGLLRFRPGDQVLVVTTPPSLPFVVAVAALIRGATYTLVIHDNYPEILFAVGKLGRDSMVATVLNFCNRWLYKQARKLIAVGRDMERLLLTKSDGLDVPVAVIQNWAELESVHPEPRDSNPLLEELGISDKFVLLYAGNMGHPNDVETIIESARRLEDRPEFHFLFLGTGVKEKWIRSAVEEYRLKNVTILSPKPRSEQIIFLNACDVALVSLVDNMLGVSMPSRTYNILAAGKPILALTDPDSELATVIGEDRVGWHLRPGNVDELTRTILDIYEARNELSAFGKRARESALEKYSLDAAISKYRRELEA